MQRYHAANCTSAVNNSAIGGASARDNVRVDSSSLPANFSINPRRPSLLAPYKLKCDKEPLNSRLGPPDFHPQSQSCPEENLTREYAQSGYRETVEGLEESREISLSQVQAFTKPLVVKCKDAIRKRLRAINESRAQKRKAGQVYGVPLSGSLLTKPGTFPDQRPCSEDFRKKWIEGLSQQHKRLRSLADNVPHGYRKKTLFEVLIKNNVPLLRATWFIKITYLNQVRPGSSSISSGTPDKTQLSRTELWTKDIVDYLQYLLDEFFSRNNSHSTPHLRDRSPQIFYTGLLQHKSDSPSAILDGEEPSLHFKWWYVVRLLQWHQAEGLLLPSLIVDWVLSQLQEKELLEVLQLLLPIIYGVLETVILSQTYVRIVVGIAIRFIRETSPGRSDPVDNSRRAYTTSALVEMLRYLILAVPDTFVALDCFPLPPCVVSHSANDGKFAPKTPDDAAEMRYGSAESICSFRSKDLDVQYQSLAFDRVVSSIQKCADNLAKTASPGYPNHSVGKAIHALDKSLLQGDIRGAYKYLFEDYSDGAVNENWIGEVSPCLKSSLKWIKTVSLAFVCSVFSLCEWATCDFRDFRTTAPYELKFTGGKDFSQVYIAIRLLKMKLGDLQRSSRGNYDDSSGVKVSAKDFRQQNNFLGRSSVGNIFARKSRSKTVEGKIMNDSDIFESPGPLHDIIVCWIDQHEVRRGEGSKRLQLLITELIRAGILYPHSYVRQLMVSGIMDLNGPALDTDRWRRHYRILKHLPGRFMQDSLEEAKIVQGSQLLEVMHVYSNERRLVLHKLVYDQHGDFCYENMSSTQRRKDYPTSGKDGSSPASINQLKTVQSSRRTFSSKNVKSDTNIEELKEAISTLLQLPNGSTSTDTETCESQGSVKRPSMSIYSKMELPEATPGCEECKRAKKQKVSEDRSLYLLGYCPVPLEEEEIWWMRKEPKYTELKVETPLKSTKPVSKGRQKAVRKTHSLAQLAAARIEGSQGASTSHICENKVSCPHHRTGMDGDTPKHVDGIRTNLGGDIVSLEKALKQLRFLEKRAITVWLMTVIRQLIEETEKASAKAGQFNRPFTSVDDRTPIRWKLGEDELSAILYLMGICNDLASAVKFLLWLLPKVQSSPISTINSRRSILLLPRNAENQPCEVGEAYLLSSLRRYENILVAMDLIPEVLSAIVSRAAGILASNGRVSSSAALMYARHLLTKYSSVVSVIEWEKSFKVTIDKRLISELESGSSLDGELGFALGVPAGVDNPDDFFRQKISGGRLSRVGMGMRDLVQRRFEDAFQSLCVKERKLFADAPPKGPAIEKSDDGYQIAQGIITGVMDCIRQTGGAAQEGDPSLVSSAVSAIVSNVGVAVSKISDYVTSSGSSVPSTTGPLNFARRILRIHINCLCLLKEALGERQSRVFEISLATEVSSALAGVFPLGKASRTQFHSSADMHESTTTFSGENTKTLTSRATKIAAAVSALVIGAVIHGVTSLERLVTLFRLKEGLDVIQFVRSTKFNSNGNARAVGVYKIENSIEIYVHLFRLLVGNCRTIFDGLIVELLGEPSVVALSRMQRMLPLSLVFPPAYSIFACLLWRPFILNPTLAAREDMNQLYQSLTIAMGDVIRHLPFRDVCLRDCQSFYDFVVADAGDVEFAAILELNGSDRHFKSMAFVPLRARLFLNAIIDCKLPNVIQDDGNRISKLGDGKIQYADSKVKLVDRIVHVLDTLQPAKFHWQWVELRLLLNEQALLEKLETHDIPFADAIRLSSPGFEKVAASDNEKNFIEIILTRLLVRPDAASLFSDVIHLFGQSLEDSMLLQAKWFLGGIDVLMGRKSIRQRLTIIAESRGLSTKVQFWKPWGWCNSGSDPSPFRGDKKKVDVSYLEEGEVVEEGMDSRRSGKGLPQTLDSESYNAGQQYETEKALVELVLPCIDQSSVDSHNTFASDLIKQMNNIEQQISVVNRGASKQSGAAPSGIEGPASKVNTRKGMKGGSPGLARRSAVPADSTPPSPSALRASMSLRLQLLLRLLPVIRADREPSGRNMRHMLASAILRLLGNRVVHEDADLSSYTIHSLTKKEVVESPSEVSSTAFTDLFGESLFDRLLLVLHGLLSTCEPSWLRSKPAMKLTNEFSKDFAGLDRELAESLQNDLDCMQLPDTIRWRIQAAIPILLPPVRTFVSCQPPTVPISTLTSLQPSTGNSSAQQGNKVPSSRIATNTPGKSKSLSLQDNYMEIDPWTLLEDGAGSCQSSSSSSVIGGGGDHANFRASSLLKGAVRVRRTDLSYIGAVDDDS